MNCKKKKKTIFKNYIWLKFKYLIDDTIINFLYLFKILQV